MAITQDHFHRRGHKRVRSEVEETNCTPCALSTLPTIFPSEFAMMLTKKVQGLSTYDRC